jgi:hypothetical protein
VIFVFIDHRRLFSLSSCYITSGVYSILKSIELVEKLLELHATLPIAAHLPKRYVCVFLRPNCQTAAQVLIYAIAMDACEVLELLTHVSIFHFSQEVLISTKLLPYN